MYKVKIPKILFLALDMASFYRRSFFNTNDLTEYANKYKNDLVRMRSDKIDYKYLDDTNFGGLRGNFSTLLTWKGFVKRGNLIISRYNIGKDNKLINSVCNGKIILDKESLTANTNDKKLKRILEQESSLLNIREKQAHIKQMLEKNSDVPLSRDFVNFPKASVVKSNNRYFIRSMINNYADEKKSIIEYSILNLWEGKKLKKKNIHPLIVIPSDKNSWDKIYAIRNEDLFDEKPLLLYVDIAKKECFDKKEKKYKLYILGEAIQEFSSGDENIEKRLDYDWEELKKRECKEEIEQKEIKEDEYSVFVNLFLDWKKNFIINNKKVINIKVSSSGGPDVILFFSGGTNQKVELEHTWKSYIDHGHYKHNAWSNVWLYSEEEWNKDLILKLFKELKKIHHERIPDVFLCIHNNERKAYKVNWDNEKFDEMKLKF